MPKFRRKRLRPPLQDALRHLDEERAREREERLRARIDPVVLGLMDREFPARPSAGLPGGLQYVSSRSRR